MISLAASRSTWPAYQAYFSQTGVHLVQPSADAATAGRWWFLNPESSNKRVYLVRVDLVCQYNVATLTPTGPRITLERMTFTAAGSGSVTPVSALSGAPAPTAVVRTTAPPGAAAVAAFHAFMVSAALTAAGAVPVSADYFCPDEPLELTSGQGVVRRQPDSATASESARRFATTVHWIEL